MITRSDDSEIEAQVKAQVEARTPSHDRQCCQCQEGKQSVLI